MAIYTYWNNLSSQDGTAVINVASGSIRIGESGEISDSEYAILSATHLLLPGIVGPWTPEEVKFNFQLDGNVSSARTSGGGGGSGVTYNWKTPGVSSAVNLPSGGNVVNDATLTLDTQTLYAWDGTQWKTLAVFGTGGAPSGGLPSTIFGGDSTTTSFTSTIFGGDASTTSFVQTINGGTA